MSITQDYEKLRIQIGNKKYDALDEYIRTHGKVHEWHQGIKSIRNIENIKEWEDKMVELHKKCKPIFIEDVVMNETEMEKFDKWYEENKDRLMKEKQKNRSKNKEAR